MITGVDTTLRRKPNRFGADALRYDTSVGIYYAAHDVKQPYKVIGHLTVPDIGQDSVKSRFVAYAKTIGADPILITVNTVDTGTKGGSHIVNADAFKYSN